MKLMWLSGYLATCCIFGLESASPATALQYPDENIEMDPVSWSWEFIDQSSGPLAVPMFGQICQIYTNASTQTDQLLVYAGYHPSGISNSLYRYDFVTRQAFGLVQHTLPGGSIPWKRGGGAAILDPTKRKMLVFGGSASPGEALGDTWELDVQTSTWTEYTPGVGFGPSRRYGSSIVYIPEWTCSLLFAGSLWKEQLYYNDLWCYSFDVHEWREVEPGFGSSPAPRFGHTAVYYEGYMYIYGGGEKDSEFGNVWAFVIEKKQWGVVLTSPPPARAFMQSVIVESYWVVIGGSKNSSTDNMEVWRWPISPGAIRGGWEQVIMGGMTLSGRMDHCVVNHNNGSYVYMLGGFSYEQKGAVDDFFRFKYAGD